MQTIRVCLLLAEIQKEETFVSIHENEDTQ